MPESKPSAVELGRLLQRHRRDAGLSLEDLAKRSGLDKSTVYRIEQAQIEAPSPQKLQRLASALGTEVEDYFALAGYFTAHGLPNLEPYLRAKYDATPEEAREVESYFAWLQTRRRADKQPDQDAA